MTGDTPLSLVIAIKAENADLHHRLKQELDRNRALQERINELETTLVLYRKRLGINESS